MKNRAALWLLLAGALAATLTVVLAGWSVATAQITPPGTPSPMPTATSASTMVPKALPPRSMPSMTAAAGAQNPVSAQKPSAAQKPAPAYTAPVRTVPQAVALPNTGTGGLRDAAGTGGVTALPLVLLGAATLLAGGVWRSRRRYQG